MPRRPADDLRRRGPWRPPRRRILIVCEGEVTEPDYFNTFRRDLRNPLVEVEIDGRGGPPKTLVERAARRKRKAESEARRESDAYLGYDEVWCVFDVDDHAHLAAAREQARRAGIQLAVSNPCFELWALLHFQAQTARIERKRAGERLRRHLPGYEKSLSFERLKPGYPQAVERAQHLDRCCDESGRPGDNPSTGVYRLTERIREEGKDNYLRSLRRDPE